MSDGCNTASIPALVISLQSKLQSRGLPSKKVLLEMDCVHHVELLQATTPDDFALQDVVHPHVLATLRHWFNRVSVRDLGDCKQVACALSHIRAWQRCVELGTPLLVAEDDVCTHRKQLLENQVALRNVPADAHVLSLLNLTGDFARGYLRNLFESPSSTSLVRQEFSGLQCYLLMPEGARLLLRHAMPVVMHVDRYVGDCVYAGLRLYRCGHSSVAYTPGSSTLSHTPAAAWTLAFVSGTIVLVLLAVCAALAARLVRR
jgi:hypothetical protein